MSGGFPVSRAFAKGHGKDAGKGGDFSFVTDQRQPHRVQQASQSGCHHHSADGNQQDQRDAHTPDFIFHTGDLSQLSKPSEFDALDQALKGASAKQIYFVPGEQDILRDNGKQYLQRYGKDTWGQAGNVNVFLLLLDPSEDDLQDRGAIRHSSLNGLNEYDCRLGTIRGEDNAQRGHGARPC